MTRLRKPIPKNQSEITQEAIGVPFIKNEGRPISETVFSKNRGEDLSMKDDKVKVINVGLQDLDYDNKPSKEFIERLRMALEGDPKMGNGQKDTANTIPSNVGKDLYNSIDKEKEKREEELVSYVKDPAPTTDVNESEKKSKEVVLEEIKRMKDMASYNKKTQ